MGMNFICLPHISDYPSSGEFAISIKSSHCYRLCVHVMAGSPSRSTPAGSTNQGLDWLGKSQISSVLSLTYAIRGYGKVQTYDRFLSRISLVIQTPGVVLWRGIIWHPLVHRRDHTSQAPDIEMASSADATMLVFTESRTRSTYQMHRNCSKSTSY